MEPFIKPTQTSPILDLPDDLTYHIFLLCHGNDPRNFPTTILRVCSQWRQFALSVPTLWSAIDFDKSLQDEQVIKKIETQLERARMSPLDIHIHESAIHKPAIKNMLKLCQFILPLVQQWRSIVVDWNIPHTALRLLFDRLTNTSAPQLEKVEMNYGIKKWLTDMAVKWKFKAFGGGAPKLQYLQLSRCRFNWNSDMFNNLIDLEIKDSRLLKMNRTEIFLIARDLLARSPRLRRLALIGTSWNDLESSTTRPPPDIVQETLIHSAIQFIEIPLCKGAATDALLHSVKMPSLEDVTSVPSYYILPFSFHTLAHFNPLPNFRHIRIHGFNDRPKLTAQERTALPLAIRTMHRLERLEFRNLDLNESRSWLPDLLFWLPELVILEFFNCQGLYESALRDMIRRGSQTNYLTLALFSAVQFDSKPDGLTINHWEELLNFLGSKVGTLSHWR